MIKKDLFHYESGRIFLILGVSEEDLYKDYIGIINNSLGDTLAEKTRNYLIDAGVSEQILTH